MQRLASTARILVAAGVAAQVTRPRIIVSEGEASRSELSIYDNDAEEAEYELIEDTPLLAPYVGFVRRQVWTMLDVLESGGDQVRAHIHSAKAVFHATIVESERSFFPVLGTLAAGYASAIVFRSRPLLRALAIPTASSAVVAYYYPLSLKKSYQRVRASAHAGPVVVTAPQPIAPNIDVSPVQPLAQAVEAAIVPAIQVDSVPEQSIEQAKHARPQAAEEPLTAPPAPVTEEPVAPQPSEEHEKPETHEATVSIITSAGSITSEHHVVATPDTTSEQHVEGDYGQSNPEDEAAYPKRSAASSS